MSKKKTEKEGVILDLTKSEINNQPEGSLSDLEGKQVYVAAGEDFSAIPTAEEEVGQTRQSTISEPEIRKEKLLLFCEFTESEVAKLGLELADAYGRLSDIEDEKKCEMEAFRNRITTEEQVIKNLAGKIVVGKEERMVDCHILIDVPPGQKTCYREDKDCSHDPESIVWVKDLEPHERQRDLPLEVPHGEFPQEGYTAIPEVTAPQMESSVEA